MSFPAVFWLETQNPNLIMRKKADHPNEVTDRLTKGCKPQNVNIMEKERLRDPFRRQKAKETKTAAPYADYLDWILTEGEMLMWEHYGFQSGIRRKQIRYKYIQVTEAEYYIYRYILRTSLLEYTPKQALDSKHNLCSKLRGKETSSLRPRVEERREELPE